MNNKRGAKSVQEKILIIVGPTAVGKTSLGVHLAEKFNGEVISGDSMQIYKNLDIGTAKITNEEARDVPHYLIDEKEINESYSVSEFQKEGRKLISEISSRGKLPIIVGGTGLYIESLIYDVSHGGDVEPDKKFRKEKEKFAEEFGNHALWKKLKELDEKAAEKVHENNVRRVIRALEVYHVSGKLYSDLQNEKKDKEKLYDTYIIGLNTDRQVLYERINHRVDAMLEEGLEKEARYLFEQVEEGSQSTKAIGYKEFFAYFKDKADYENVIETIKQNSRRYAKRQLTWFRNRIEVDQWFDLVENPEELKDIEERVTTFVE